MVTHKKRNIPFLTNLSNILSFLACKEDLNMPKIVIIDDMYEYGHIIKTSLLNINNHFDVDIFTSTRDFLTHLESFPDYTVFIIDVLLGNSNGVDIARTVTQVKKGAQIIFVSIDIETVKDIFDVNPCYFIHKMDLEKHLPKAIEKALHNIKKLQRTVTLILKDKTVILEYHQIMYMHRKNRRTFIYCLNETIEIAMKVSELYQQLPTDFIRCHNSYIINPLYIKEYKRDKLVLKDDTVIPISRAYKKEVKEQLFDITKKRN